MKKIIILGAIVISALVAACDDITPETVDFKVVADKTTVNVGEPVTFSFDGNPNFITFFSGEEGHKYVNRNRVELDPSEIELSSLSFTVGSQYGTQTKACSVYLSKDFPGLNLKKAKQDSTLIKTHAWTDITETCGLVDGKNVTVPNFSLADYINGFTLAFRFLGTTETPPQRSLTITGLMVKNQLKSGVTTLIKGSDMNFSCFELEPSNPEKDPYKKIISGTAISGSWNLTKLLSANEIRFQGGKPTDTTWANNDDWLITDRIKLNSCTPDLGENIKEITHRLSNYHYTFTKPGVYTVSFLAVNASVEGQKTVLKEVQITVNDVK